MPKRAVSVHWPRSARPTENDCSAGDMKTLARDRDKADILRRLRTVRPGSAARWGRMSAHQMVCHLTDAFRVVIGQKPVSPATNPFSRTVIKWTALYAPLRW